MMCLAVGNPKARGIFNCVHNKGITHDGMVRLCAKVMAVDCPPIVHYNPSEVGGKKAFLFRPVHFYAQPVAATSLLGWAPKAHSPTCDCFGFEGGAFIQLLSRFSMIRLGWAFWLWFSFFGRDVRCSSYCCSCVFNAQWNLEETLAQRWELYKELGRDKKDIDFSLDDEILAHCEAQ
jgi:hypothetical protein